MASNRGKTPDAIDALGELWVIQRAVEFERSATGESMASALTALAQRLDEAIAQIRADHAYVASAAGSPCSCKWCHS